MAATGDDGRLRRAVEIIQDLERRLAAREQLDSEPIAIIGMAGRMPGADDPERLWQLLAEGRDPIRGVAAGSCGLIESPGFDADFFQISAREAASMDQRQRLTLETSWAVKSTRVMTLE